MLLLLQAVLILRVAALSEDKVCTMISVMITNHWLRFAIFFVLHWRQTRLFRKYERYSELHPVLSPINNFLNYCHSGEKRSPVWSPRMPDCTGMTDSKHVVAIWKIFSITYGTQHWNQWLPYCLLCQDSLPCSLLGIGVFQHLKFYGKNAAAGNWIHISIDYLPG